MKTWLVRCIDDATESDKEFDSWEAVVDYVNTEIDDGVDVHVMEQHWQVTSTTPYIWTAPF